MSGLMGIYNLDGRSVNRTDLEKMTDVLAHRGPDGAETWVEGEIGLGHRMLWTTPESLVEKLPLVTPTGLVITADARIDNRDELQAVLDLPDCPIEKITDSEFILAAYEKWGEDCSQYLIGDFSFAIWDSRKQQLFCSRDHFGVKPFYYHHNPQKRFLFASEIKALIHLPCVPHRINHVRIADYLVLMLEDQIITTYEEILRLPPAHNMVLSAAGIRTWRYWQLNRDQKVSLASDEDYVKTFRYIFTDAVRCRVRSAFPVGCHLSGGLDSSSVTCVARQILAEQNRQCLHTFSNIFDAVPECDERPYINAVLNQGGLIPHYIKADQFGPLTHLHEVFQFADEAYLGASYFYPWNLNRATSKAGVRVCLDGFDGDTTVSHGMHKFAEYARQGNWQGFADEARQAAQNRPLSPMEVLRWYGLPYLEELATQWKWWKFLQTVQQVHQCLGVSRKHLIVRHGLIPAFIEPIRLWWKKLWIDSEVVLNIPSLINPKFAKQVGFKQRINQFQNAIVPQTVKDFHWQSFQQGGFVYALEQSDQFAAAFSIEARHPFMDKRLIEFCVALPSEQKMNQGWGRWIMRQALEGLLPSEIQWRGSKTIMAPNFERGILTIDRQLADDLVLYQAAQLKHWINLEFLSTIYQRFTVERNVREKDIVAIWRAICLLVWMQCKQIDGYVNLTEKAALTDTLKEQLKSKYGGS